ncbi:MAG: hypothetical protein VYE64_03690 [Planctomycetota bacterium]|nr:hypothetical protein [Planctomycetota bacterium]
MIRSKLTLAITAICVASLTFSAAVAQECTICPANDHGTAKASDDNHGKKIEWNHFGLFKTVKLEASTNKKQASESDSEGTPKHKNEIRVEIGVNARQLLSGLPLLANMFSKQTDNGNNPKPAERMPRGIHIDFSNDSRRLPQDGSTGVVLPTSHSEPIQDTPECCPSKEICPASSGGCCARPDPVLPISKSSVTGAACCESAKPCCESNRKSPCAGKASCQSTPACCQITPPSQETAKTVSCRANPQTLMLANFAEQASVEEQQRWQYMEELLELRVENAELKVALNAAERHAEMLQRMAELREQNAILRAELQRQQMGKPLPRTSQDSTTVSR